MEVITSASVAQAVSVSMKNIFCMEGGQGEASYMNNSQVQSKTLQLMMHFLKETLDRVQLAPRPEAPLTAADLGCSSGQNTLMVADVIAQHMTEAYGAAGHAAPDFFFYFSDLPSNDFNTLFRLLAGEATGRRLHYIAAGVPGSFYGRLFPTRFVDVFTSTFSLHWLSQVPEAVADERSPAYNRGKVFLHGGSAATGAAYRRQFQSDLASFLRCRTAELKRGGAMYLVCLGRPAAAGDPTDHSTVELLFGTLFQDSWGDLVGEGLVAGEKMDSFNVPFYAPTLEEFREVVEADGSFEIGRLEMVMASRLVADDDPRAAGRAVANFVRSLLGALVDAHVGKALADELFRRLRCRAEERAQEIMEVVLYPHVVCSLSLA